MYSLLRDKASRPESGPLSLAEIEERFDGNICRCTGYRPIMTAFHTFADEESPDSHEINGLPPFKFDKYDVSKEPAPPAELAALYANPKPLRIEGSDGTLWYRPTTLAEVQSVKEAHPQVKIVNGFTSQGVYGIDNETTVFVDVSKVPQLAAGAAAAADSLVVPASTTITELIRSLESNAKSSASFPEMVLHFQKVASWQVRNIGSVVGNLMMCRSYQFMSDLATVLMGAGATVRYTILATGKSFETPLNAFLRSEGDASVADNELIVTAIVIPYLKADEQFRSYRQAMRSNNAHAYVNAAFRVAVNDGVISSASFVFGCIDNAPVSATTAEKLAVGSKIDDKEQINKCLEALGEIALKPEPEYVTTRRTEGLDSFRRGLMSSFLFKFFCAIQTEGPAHLASTAVPYERTVSTGTQIFKTELPDDHPGKVPMSKTDAGEQAAGQVKYSGDLQFHQLLHAAFAQGTQAPAVVTSIDASEALAMPGVVDFVTAADIPGLNSASPFAPPEEVLMPVPFTGPAEGASEEDIAAAKKMATLLFVGQPVGMVVARSRREAEAASKKIKVTYADGGKGIYTIDEAIAAGKVEENALQADKGDIEKAFAKPGLKIFEGDFTFGGQSHFAMEKHTTTAVPDEQGRMIMYTATQGADMVRGFASAVLGRPSHKVEVNVKRLGGAFGAKFTKNIWTAMATAVCANKLNAPVVCQNSIEVDMTMGGNSRHPFKLHYKAAIDPSNNKVAAFELDAYQDKGCASDFSGFVGNEIISHSESLYSFEAIKVRVHMVNTNTSSNTAVRAPGIAQAVAIGEAMMDHMAAEIQADPEEFRKANFLSESESTMNGTPLAVTGYTMPLIWDELSKSSELAARKAAVAEFNKQNRWVKRGIAMTPSRYSLGPGLNAGVTCLINVHGSDMGGPTVEVHHGGHEMGQGLNTKVQQMVALKLKIPLESVHVHATSTAVSPNISITGGSVGSETTVAAAAKACDTLLARVQPVKEMIVKENAEAAKKDGKPEPTDEPTFAEVAAKAVGGLMNGLKVNLQVSENWSPKEGHLPNQVAHETEQSPLPQGAYLAFGAGVSEVEVDILTGDLRVLRSDILYDCGHSLNPLLDIGQAEGAFVMGQGFYTGEEIHYAPDGECITKGTWEYKPTLATNMPRDFRIEFLKDSPYAAGVMRAKAVGEPPLVFAYSIFAAVKQAISASRVERGLSSTVIMDVPATCERIFAAAQVESKDLVESM